MGRTCRAQLEVARLILALSLFGILTFGAGVYGLILAREARKLSRLTIFIGACVLAVGIALLWLAQRVGKDLIIRGKQLRLVVEPASDFVAEADDHPD